MDFLPIYLTISWLLWLGGTVLLAAAIFARCLHGNWQRVITLLGPLIVSVLYWRLLIAKYEGVNLVSGVEVSLLGLGYSLFGIAALSIAIFDAFRPSLNK